MSKRGIAVDPQPGGAWDKVNMNSLSMRVLTICADKYACKHIVLYKKA
ncbi:hypothetical protein [Paenibacillus sp. L3-i20]|nr:hypothetical protein [Paenibacillus sp. L3-i20]GKU78342.1 hypothetical protein L3i20_v227390 [Paenibacillus sp. L3-i20]